MQHVAPAHNYASFDAAKEALRTVGQQIEQGYLPSDFCPMIFTITGSGNVSQVCINKYYFFSKRIIHAGGSRTNESPSS